jgi:hypothetical protein
MHLTPKVRELFSRQTYASSYRLIKTLFIIRLVLAKDEERKFSCSRGTTFIRCYLTVATSVSTVALCLITETSGRGLLSPTGDFFSQLQGLFHGSGMRAFQLLPALWMRHVTVTRPCNAFNYAVVYWQIRRAATLEVARVPLLSANP